MEERVNSTPPASTSMVTVQVYTYYRLADALAAAWLGADHVGIAVLSREPGAAEVYLSDPEWRRIFQLTTPQRVAEIFARLKGVSKRVLMPLASSIEGALGLLDEAGGDILHTINQWGPREYSELRASAGVEVMASIFITPGGWDENRAEVERALALDREGAVDYLLLDTRLRDWRGVTGRTHNWSISRYIARHTETPVILAGGLNHGNVAQALDAVEPWGVDACTGLDASPGVKDLTKVWRFIQEARRWEARHRRSA